MKNLMSVLFIVLISLSLSCSDIVNSDSSLRIERTDKSGIADSINIEYFVGNELTSRKFGTELDYGRVPQIKDVSKVLTFINYATDNYNIKDIRLKKNVDFNLLYPYNAPPFLVEPNTVNLKNQLIINAGVLNKNKGVYTDTLIIDNNDEFILPIKIEIY